MNFEFVISCVSCELLSNFLCTENFINFISLDIGDRMNFLIQGMYTNSCEIILFRVND